MQTAMRSLLTSDVTRIIAITNQKGGVGKTTTAVNLASCLAHAGSRVLLVDMDPQANATGGCGLDVRSLEISIYDVLLGLEDIAGSVVDTGFRFSIIPAVHDLAGAQVELHDLGDRDHRLKSALAKVCGDFDIILIDCAPALNVLTLNALAAADEVMIPVQCEYYALEGLTSLMKTIDMVRNGLNPGLEISGLIRTMFDRRNGLAVEVSDQLNDHFPDTLLRTVIPRNVRLAEAPGHGLPIIDYDRRCTGAQAYLALGCEVLRRNRLKRGNPDGSTKS